MNKTNSPTFRNALIFNSAIIFFLITSGLQASAQTDTSYYKRNKLYYMAEFGFGISNIDFGGLLGLSLFFNKNLIGLRENAVVEFRLDNNSESVAGTDLIFGRKFNAGNFHNFSLATGVSYVNVKRRDENYYNESTYEYDMIKTNTVGLPIELKYWNNALWRYLGGGVTLGANINPKQSYVNLTLGLMIGNTRESRSHN